MLILQASFMKDVKRDPNYFSAYSRIQSGFENVTTRRFTYSMTFYLVLLLTLSKFCWCSMINLKLLLLAFNNSLLRHNNLKRNSNCPNTAIILQHRKRLVSMSWKSNINLRNCTHYFIHRETGKFITSSGDFLLVKF